MNVNLYKEEGTAMKNDTKMLYTVCAAQKAMGGCVLCVCMWADGESACGNVGSILLLSTGMLKKRIT